MPNLVTLAQPYGRQQGVPIIMGAGSRPLMMGVCLTP